MTKGVVATMDTIGFIKEPEVKADRAFAYWFANRVDQCIILKNIHSYQYVVAKHQDDKGSTDPFLAELKTNLTEYLEQIFDNVSVDARAIKDNELSKMFTLAFSATFDQDGVTYQFNKSVMASCKTYELVMEGRKGNVR